MRRIILACALAGVLAVPANALDGTPAPANIWPAIKAPPDLQLCGYAGCLPQDPNVERAARELLERARQLRHDADKLVAQTNPGPNGERRSVYWDMEAQHCEINIHLPTQ